MQIQTYECLCVSIENEIVRMFFGTADINKFTFLSKINLISLAVFSL